MSDTRTRCQHCDTPLTQPARGRRLFCSQRCQQTARRRRNQHAPVQSLIRSHSHHKPYELERLHAKALTLARMQLTGAVLTDYRRWNEQQWTRIPVLWRLVFNPEGE